MELQDLINKMDSSIQHLEKEFQTIRTSRANPTMLENIFADAYGAKTPINQLGNISSPDTSMLTIQVWDTSLLKNIENAILESNLGINPQVDGSLIRLTVSRYYTPLGRCIQKPYSYDEDIYWDPNSKKNLNIDTLQQFFTKSGKTVYGGGGITPDEIINKNDEMLPGSLLYLYTSDFFNDLAFEYVDAKRDKLDNIKFQNFHISELDKQIILDKITKWILEELEDVYLEDDLKEDIKKGKIKILNRINALIIRQYWGWGEMQMFLNETDEIIARSLYLLKNKTE